MADREGICFARCKLTLKRHPNDGPHAEKGSAGLGVCATLGLNMFGAGNEVAVAFGFVRLAWRHCGHGNSFSPRGHGTAGHPGAPRGDVGFAERGAARGAARELPGLGGVGGWGYAHMSCMKGWVCCCDGWGWNKGGTVLSGLVFCWKAEAAVAGGGGGAGGWEDCTKCGARVRGV